MWPSRRCLIIVPDFTATRSSSLASTRRRRPSARARRFFQYGASASRDGLVDPLPSKQRLVVEVRARLRERARAPPRGPPRAANVPPSPPAAASPPPPPPPPRRRRRPPRTRSPPTGRARTRRTSPRRRDSGASRTFTRPAPSTLATGPDPPPPSSSSSSSKPSITHLPNDAARTASIASASSGEQHMSPATPASATGLCPREGRTGAAPPPSSVPNDSGSSAAAAAAGDEREDARVPGDAPPARRRRRRERGG